jgi:hypothetical protein
MSAMVLAAAPEGMARHRVIGYLGDWLNTLRADPRQAVKEDVIHCLICGRALRQLTNTHLRAHGSGAAEYKRRFGYNRGRPLMCHALQRFYAERAVQSGLAARIRSRPILVQPELRRLGGARAIALEELLSRRDARRRPEDLPPIAPLRAAIKLHGKNGRPRLRKNHLGRAAPPLRPPRPIHGPPKWE